MWFRIFSNTFFIFEVIKQVLKKITTWLIKYPGGRKSNHVAENNHVRFPISRPRIGERPSGRNETKFGRFQPQLFVRENRERGRGGEILGDCHSQFEVSGRTKFKLPVSEIRPLRLNFWGEILGDRHSQFEVSGKHKIHKATSHWDHRSLKFDLWNWVFLSRSENASLSAENVLPEIRLSNSTLTECTKVDRVARISNLHKSSQNLQKYVLSDLVTKLLNLITNLRDLVRNSF